MNSINDILGMIATEARDGTWGDFGIGDEAPPVQQSYENIPLNANLLLEKYDIGLIRDANGNIVWVE